MTFSALISDSDHHQIFLRCEKVVDLSEALLEGEVYFYHGKMVVKEAKVGGKQIWHQDYGYWYNNSLMTPQALSVFIPLDETTKENGYLQVIRLLLRHL